MKDNKFSQDDSTRQKQRAEELTKNIEDKIQKARERRQQELESKKQKNQQELEFKKKNNPEFRDYDKEPIVLKNYEMSFYVLSDIIPLSFAGIIIVFLNAIVSKNFDNLVFTAGFILIGTILWIGFEFVEHKFENGQILLKNRVIEFYEKSKLVNTANCENFKIYIQKPFAFYSSNDKKILGLEIFVTLICISFILVFTGIVNFIYAIFFIILYLCGNFFMKCAFPLFLAEKLDRRFSLFPAITVCKSPIKSMQQIGVYRMIILFSKTQYAEVKEYFLNLHNINIDNIEKIYF